MTKKLTKFFRDVIFEANSFKRISYDAFYLAFSE